jgi:hypothetical protein
MLKTKVGTELGLRTPTPSESRVAETTQVCPSCGASIQPTRMSLAELATNAICVLVLAAILIPACWLAEHWLEQQGQRTFDHLIWHEPLQDW